MDGRVGVVMRTEIRRVSQLQVTVGGGENIGKPENPVSLGIGIAEQGVTFKCETVTFFFLSSLKQFGE